MYTANPYNIYKQNSVNMASSQQLLLMLLDGAVKYTKIARMAILNKDIARAHKELVRVQDIFLELMITMDKNTKYMEDLYHIWFYKKWTCKSKYKKRYHYNRYYSSAYRRNKRYVVWGRCKDKIRKVVGGFYVKYN